jgi:hypothetical protein
MAPVRPVLIQSMAPMRSVAAMCPVPPHLATPSNLDHVCALGIGNSLPGT